MDRSVVMMFCMSGNYVLSVLKLIGQVMERNSHVQNVANYRKFTKQFILNQNNLSVSVNTS